MAINSPVDVDFKLGKTYFVKINDCCVSLNFYGLVIDIKPDTENTEGYVEFDNLVKITHGYSHAIEITEIVA